MTGLFIYLEWFLLTTDKLFRPPAGYVMNSRITPSGTTAIGELCFEHVHSIPGKMVSQSIGWGDSPVDLCEGSNRAFQDTDQPACQLDVRLLRHKASWINPLCVQQPLQELCPQRPTVQSSENHVVLDTPSPLRLSILSYRDSLAEMPLSENTADVICSNSAHCSGGKEGDFFLATEEQEVHLQQESLLKNPKTVATSPSPKEGSARSESPHLTASTDDGNPNDFLYSPSLCLSGPAWKFAYCLCHEKQSSWPSTLTRKQCVSSFNISTIPHSVRVTIGGSAVIFLHWEEEGHHFSLAWLIISSRSHLWDHY